MKTIEKIRQKIEELYDGEAPKHDQQCDFSDGYFTGLSVISNFLDTLSEEPDKSLEEAAEEYEHIEGHFYYPSIKDAFKAGAEWAFMQGWTFNAHKGDFGICFDGSIDNLLDSLKDDEEVTVQIRKK